MREICISISIDYVFSKYLQKNYFYALNENCKMSLSYFTTSFRFFFFYTRRWINMKIYSVKTRGTDEENDKDTEIECSFKNYPIEIFPGEDSSF